MEVIGENFVLVKKLHKNENTNVRGKQNRDLSVFFLVYDPSVPLYSTWLPNFLLFIEDGLTVVI